MQRRMKAEPQSRARAETGDRALRYRGRPAGVRRFIAAIAGNPVIRLHRHLHGPRVYVLGQRIHEWHLGLSLIALVFAGRAAGLWDLSIAPLLVVGAGGYLVLKDWRDIVPSKRDTSAWRLRLHRR